MERRKYMVDGVLIIIPAEMYVYSKHEFERLAYNAYVSLGVVEKIEEIRDIATEYCKVFGMDETLFAFRTLSEEEYTTAKKKAFSELFAALQSRPAHILLNNINLSKN